MTNIEQELMNLEDLAFLLEWYRKSIPDGHSQENYLVQIDSTRKLVETRRAELQRKEKKELISQKHNEIRSLKMSKDTRTVQSDSQPSVDPTTELYSGYIPRSNPSISPAELYIAQ